jgi:hypothetical protein
MVCTPLCYTTQVHMGLLVRSYTWVSGAALALSVAAYFLTAAVLDSLFCPDSAEPVQACGIVIPQAPPPTAPPRPTTTRPAAVRIGRIAGIEGAARPIGT